MAQLELFAPGPRIELSEGAWIEHHVRWVPDHEDLFAELRATAAWREETMRMYDRVVAVPRLLAGALPHPRVEKMRRELSARYGEEFVRTTLALYRDGRDSVAMHGDTTARDMDQALVATVSLGAPRRFVLRPAAGGRSITFDLGGGDLFVMGGTCQRTWRHGIPKVAHAGERIALMFRPKWGDRYP
jgi:alkylated DNA repair dioxygenase AlkB